MQQLLPTLLVVEPILDLHSNTLVTTAVVSDPGKSIVAALFSKRHTHLIAKRWSFVSFDGVKTTPCAFCTQQSSFKHNAQNTNKMSRPKGPLGIDPLTFSVTLFGLLLVFVLYLLLPRALRKQYFGAYPRRHAWSARSRARRSRGYGDVRFLL